MLQMSRQAPKIGGRPLSGHNHTVILRGICFPLAHACQLRSSSEAKASMSAFSAEGGRTSRGYITK